MKTKPFSELLHRMTTKQREEIETRVQLALLHITLIQLQESLEITQEDKENNLETVKSALSQLENDEDIQVSTLSSYIKALGGSLKLVADFPDEEIVLAKFE